MHEIVITAKDDFESNLEDETYLKIRLTKSTSSTQMMLMSFITFQQVLHKCMQEDPAQCAELALIFVNKIRNEFEQLKVDENAPRH